MTYAAPPAPPAPVGVPSGVGIIGGRASVQRSTIESGMERPATTTLRIGAWSVNPASGQISRDGETARLEVRTLRLLLCLAEHAGEVVSIDDLLTQVWPGVIVTQDSVYQSVASLRRLLGDDPKQPTYIETVPRLGYRLVATVGRWTDIGPFQKRLISQQSSLGGHRFLSTRLRARVSRGPPARRSASRSSRLSSCTARSRRPSLGLGRRCRAATEIHRRAAVSRSHRRHERGAVRRRHDRGVDRQAQQDPGASGHAAHALFYFKGKLGALSRHSEIRRQMLGVAYVLDGSVRKSGSRLRVAARLIRADDGFVVWSETYDRPFDDILMVQDDIAGEVAKALQASIESNPAQPPHPPN